MKRPHSFYHVGCRAVLLCGLCLLLILPGVSQAQQPAQTSASETERGIKLYEQGEMKGAIKALREAVKKDKKDANAWHYLGLALTRTQDLFAARKAFATAVKLKPDFTVARAALARLLLLENRDEEARSEAERVLASDARNAVAHYVIGDLERQQSRFRSALAEAEKALQAKPDFISALFLKGRALNGIVSLEISSATKEQRELFITQSKELVTEMENVLRSAQIPEDVNLWPQLLSVLRAYAAGDFSEPIYTPKDVTRKARVKSKHAPDIGMAYRRYGLVTLQLVLRWNGEIGDIRVISASDETLIQSCIDAARRIKFIPAERDGRPVSQYIRVEYNFN